MGTKLSASARQQLVQAIGERYREGSKEDKVRILDEFVAVTGFHRKHSIRILNRSGESTGPTPLPRLRLYDQAVREALVVLWEASDRICGKRLKPLVPLLVVALERHGHLQLDSVIRTKVLKASAATIDRLLAEPRSATGRRRRQARAAPAIRKAIAVRTFADWKEPLPGFMEADLVAHGGESVAGCFAHTLTLTDIASGWTECVALATREGSLIVEALECLRTTMPFPLRGFDTDNGGEFINETVLAFCRKHRIEFTRSRPYRKNDQAWVEQKNGSVVRRLVGYRRLEGLSGAEALARLYASSRLFVNFFQPSFKLAEKTRVGAHVSKRYHAPLTPCARLLASDAIPEDMKERLRVVATSLDPLRLLDEIRAAQHQLAGVAAGEILHVVPHRDPDLDTFLKGLGTAWHQGEVRPTHQAEPKPARHWRTRKDPFEAVWPLILGLLQDQPDRTAAQLLERLQVDYLGQFPDRLLRTLQRRIKVWRRAEARKLVFLTNDDALAAGAPN